MPEHEITDEEIKKKHKEFDDRIKKVLNEVRGTNSPRSSIARIADRLKQLTSRGNGLK